MQLLASNKRKRTHGYCKNEENALNDPVSVYNEQKKEKKKQR